MTKARDLANLISQGNPLADGGIAFSEVTGTPTTVAGYGITDSFDGAYSSLTGSPTLGTAAALDVGTGANNIPQLDSNGKLAAIDGSQLTGVSAFSFASTLAFE
tara:strand:- start:404 stop:715 length:312 start_codon:yes stop_codon:yes gene_type:complete